MSLWPTLCRGYFILGDFGGDSLGLLLSGSRVVSSFVMFMGLLKLMMLKPINKVIIIVVDHPLRSLRPIMVLDGRDVQVFTVWW
jgi:hypothetical protein